MIIYVTTKSGTVLPIDNVTAITYGTKAIQNGWFRDYGYPSSSQELGAVAPGILADLGRLFKGVSDADIHDALLDVMADSHLTISTFLENAGGFVAANGSLSIGSPLITPLTTTSNPTNDEVTHTPPRQLSYTIEIVTFVVAGISGDGFMFPLDWLEGWSTQKPTTL